MADKHSLKNDNLKSHLHFPHITMYILTHSTHLIHLTSYKNGIIKNKKASNEGNVKGSMKMVIM